MKVSQKPNHNLILQDKPKQLFIEVMKEAVRGAPRERLKRSFDPQVRPGERKGEAARAREDLAANPAWLAWPRTSARQCGRNRLTIA